MSAIANFKPVVARDLDGTTLRELLAEHPFQQFPVVPAGILTHVLTRKEAELALLQKRAPAFAPAAICLREQMVAELQKGRIGAETHFVVVLNRKAGEVIGLVALHDLLRRGRHGTTSQTGGLII